MATGTAIAELYSEEQLRFCRILPKIELHAHLNGSLRDSTIRELALQHSIDPELVKLTCKGDRTLAECFKLFDVIHSVTTDHAILTRLAREVCEDFAADNVVYLELRTTPKVRPEHGMTKHSYTEAVLAGLAEFAAQQARAGGPPMLVRLLLSIDRREDAAAAADTVALAAALAERGVVGVDLSGDPTRGQWPAWEAALRRARALGLRLTLHAGEVYNPAETAAMLALPADRLGHACFLDAALEAALAAARTPLELCLTSNVLTESVAGYPDHHFLPLHRAGHPVILCTDDSGVFSTSLSREYALAAAAFRLEKPELLALAEAAVPHAFLPDAEKQRLAARFLDFRERHAREIWSGWGDG